ncbi:unnamed protein product [Vitrella brassicaformis CCMP3155]|uniref:XPG-I domain-containing protein n=1 Tax=Vitrella brassicaformis (strain CCMP3155) TaxID=1169540 RepID=A0A0G4EKS0_VITBC|nr:unnamed protein product [Vitrella brassicaformis CCMP3155]|eukprot:CEL97049.1 unnamed protein product [Vitrella brassicaformis CCMP3155]
MGIPGLLPFVRRRFPAVISGVATLRPFAHQRLLVDGTGLLYRFAYASHGDLDKCSQKFATQLSKFREHLISPSYFFEKESRHEGEGGGNLDVQCKRDHAWRKREKDRLSAMLRADDAQRQAMAIMGEGSYDKTTEDTVKDAVVDDKRIHLKKDDVQKVVDTLGQEGCDVRWTDLDAEKECVRQCRSDSDVVVSDDVDALVFGAPAVLRNVQSPLGLMYIKREELLDAMCFSMEEFIDFCILCGCDYTEKLPGIGPVAAYEIIQKHRSIEAFLDSDDFQKLASKKVVTKVLQKSGCSSPIEFVEKFVDYK